MITHSLGNSEINSVSLRLQQPARADIIHANREIKEILKIGRRKVHVLSSKQN